MKTLYILIVTYFYIPFVTGSLRRYADRTGFTNKSLAGYLLNRFRHCSSDIKFLVILSTSLVFLTPLVFYVQLTGSRTMTLRVTTLPLMLLIVAASVIYAFSSPAIALGYKKFRPLWAFLMAVSAAINTSRAASYAESLISNLLGIRASDLPTALARLSLIMAPIAWAISFSFMFLAIYAITLFKTIVIDLNQKNNPLLTGHGAKIEKQPIKILSTGLAIPVCFAMLAVSPISLLEATLKTDWADRFIREQLVDASFHAPAKACQVSNINDALVAYLEGEKSLIAIPDKRLGYIFGKLECPSVWRKAQDITHDIKLDDMPN